MVSWQPHRAPRGLGSRFPMKAWALSVMGDGSENGVPYGTSKLTSIDGKNSPFCSMIYLASKLT